MINKVIVSGYIGQDAKVREGKGRFATFSVGHTVKWKDKDGAKHERTDWFDVSCTGDGLIDKVVLPYFKKGTYLTVTGKLSSKRVGEKTYVGILMEEFDLPPMGRSNGTDAKSAQSAAPSTPSKPADKPGPADGIPAHSFDPSDFDDMPM